MATQHETTERVGNPASAPTVTSARPVPIPGGADTAQHQESLMARFLRKLLVTLSAWNV